MSPVVQEWLNLVVRWAHVIAAIMWIGDSFLFMWLDSQLKKPDRALPGEVVGELWMAHSGGFYEVVKRKSLDALPTKLHWFKWESYTTWITGFLLLIIVYYLGGRAMLVDTESPLSEGAAVGISLGLLLGTVILYDLLCRTPLVKDNRVFGVVGLVLVTGAAYGVTRYYSPRAAFLQVGAMLGTLMASNVFFRIIPAQKHMLAATAEGRPVDTSYGARAKQRSTHNHYLTLPVLFTMLSNHFPGLYGHAYPWAVLALLFLAGAGVKYVMNFRGKTHPIVFVGTLAALGGVVAMTAPKALAIDPVYAEGPKISFATAQTIVQTRCVTCHSQAPTNPSFAAPPSGVMLDTPDRIAAYAPRVFVRAVQTRTTLALSGSLLIGYPVAYYISRHAKKTKGTLLALLVLPFWVSYMMRMLAWVNLFSPNGYINKFLVWSHMVTTPPDWLNGNSTSVVLGLIYGYVPYLILPLLAALDRIDRSVLEAARDLGASPAQAFYYVTMPLSKPGILGASVIIALPMFGDYYTPNIVSGSPRTTMIGNQIDIFFHGGPQPSVGASLTMLLSLFLAVLMAYYMITIAKAQKEMHA